MDNCVYFFSNALKDKHRAFSCLTGQTPLAGFRSEGTIEFLVMLLTCLTSEDADLLVLFRSSTCELRINKVGRALY